MKCPWCDKEIYIGELTVVVDNKEMHLHCAAEEEDNVFFDRDRESGE